MSSLLHRVNSDEQCLVSRICIVCTGGTIGMVMCPETKAYIPAKGFLEQKMKSFSPLYDDQYEYKTGDLLTHHQPLATPISFYGRRMLYCVEELDPVLDSANMNMADWARIAEVIHKYYTKFDGFVVVHGTDTMCYTASALGFMLENLGKPIVLTGSQIPLQEQRSDAVNNLLGALIFASHYAIPEVVIFFNNHLYRGNRSVKVKSEDIGAFSSPNIPPLAVMGTHITVNWNYISAATTLEQFNLQSEMSRHVGMVRLFPGITCATLRHFLEPPIEGVVLLSYGAGNAPDSRQGMLGVFKEMCDRGGIIVNITQCLEGTVSQEYHTGKVLADAGVLPGGDMTPEAALTKLSYVLAKPGLTHQERLKMMITNLRGEMTVDLPVVQDSCSSETSLFLDSNSYFSNLISVLEAPSEAGIEMLRNAIIPSLMCHAAGLGKMSKLNEAVQESVSVNKSNYDLRTPLHVATCNGHYDIVEFLLEQGASVHARDRLGNTALVDAIKQKLKYDVHLSTEVVHAANLKRWFPDCSGDVTSRGSRRIARWITGWISQVNGKSGDTKRASANTNPEIVDLLLQTGAHLQYPPHCLADEICTAILQNNALQLQYWKQAGADLNEHNSSGSTPLHLSVFLDNVECFEALIEHGADPEVQDKSGMSVHVMIKSLNRTRFMDIC